MRWTLVVSIVSFSMALVAVAALDTYTAKWPLAAQAAALGNGALASTLTGGDGPPGADPSRPQRRTP